jgi:hypothetical protein
MSSANRAPTMQWHLHCLQMDWNKILHDPRHLGVPSGVSKTLSSIWYVRRKPCIYLMLRLALSPNELNQASTWPSSTRSTIGCVQSDFWAYEMIVANHAPILHRHLHCLQTDRDEIPHDLLVSRNRLNRACSCASSPRSTIGCIQNDFWANGMFGANYAPILRQDYHYLQMDGIKLPHKPRHLSVPPGLSKTISEPMVCLAQIVHLSCTETNTISKWTKTRFHMTTSPSSSI